MKRVVLESQTSSVQIIQAEKEIVLLPSVYCVVVYVLRSYRPPSRIGLPRRTPPIEQIP
jgi:hypothetical protein